MERRFASGLAARAVIFGFVSLLIYWILPDSGVSAMKKMDATMQNARSWRVRTVVSEPTKTVESLTEVYCPSRVHTISHMVMDESGRHFEDSSEIIWIEGASYTKKGLTWRFSREERYGTASCAWGPRGEDTLLQSDQTECARVGAGVAEECVAYRDLREFVKRLEKEGELKRVKAEVDPVLEISEVVQRVRDAARSFPQELKPHSQQGENVGPKGPTPKGLGPALLFERAKGSRIPVLINTFGSVRRMELAFEVDALEDVAERIRGFLDTKSPQGLMDKIKMLPKLAELGSFFPKTVKDGACKEIVRKGSDVNLFDFPILQTWPQDAGRFITFPLVFTKNPETGKRNVGMYRMQVYDERTTGMHWQTQKHGAEHFRRARAANPEGRIPVSVAIGADPATALAGMLPIPPDLDEMMFSGFLRREPVEMVACETNELEVPANAEIVLEGYVNLNETRTEGPFGDHTGFYSLEGEYPVFHVECVTHRKEPIYLTTVVGPPPQEDYFMGYAVERVFLPVMKMQYPEIVDVAMPAEGIFHNLMIVAIRKSYPGHARKIMNAIWSLGQAMFTKVIVVVDHDVDVHNYSEVVWKALCALDPERDVQFSLGPADTLDHAQRMQDYGSKMGIDATRKWATEGFVRPWPDEIVMDEETKKRVAGMWKSLGI